LSSSKISSHALGKNRSRDDLGDVWRGQNVLIERRLEVGKNLVELMLAGGLRHAIVTPLQDVSY